MSRTASRTDLTAAMQAAAVYLRSAADRAERGVPVDPVTARRSAAALDELAGLDAPPAEGVRLLLDRADLTELAAILSNERYRMDRGDGHPLPQPRWGANVRISQAVQAALTAPACLCPALRIHQAGCPADNTEA